MKKLIMVLLLLVSQSVMAEWTYVLESDSTKTYIDISTIKKTGNGIFKYWDLDDSNEIQTLNGVDKFHSMVTSREVNCYKEEFRDFYYVLYSGHMGEGDVKGNDVGTQKWRPQVPRSIGWIELKFICDYVKKNPK